jgi:arsenite-transporting ATPase
MKGLTDFFARKGETEIVIFAGKGGLGKTTCSAALAYHMATREGRRTLCFSTDPQASLSDIFERDFFGKGIIEVVPNLHVVEIDADRRVSDYQREVKQKILDMYGLDELPEEIEEYIDSTSAEPAMYESATYDAMAELVAAKEYDIYIFDMPPFGHGVRMVAMADILSKWVDKITEARKKAEEYSAVAATLRGTKATEDEVLRELIEIRSKIKSFTDLITDQRRTAFFMVLTPEKMAILDTERALKMFEALGIGMSGLIVNMIYPLDLLESPSTSELLRHRIKMQQKYMEIIKQKFGPQVVCALPMYPMEPKGLEMIAKVAEDLMESKVEV